MIALDRIGWYPFVGLVCATYVMMARLRGGGADNSAAVTIQLALEMILSSMLYIKFRSRPARGEQGGCHRSRDRGLVGSVRRQPCCSS